MTCIPRIQNFQSNELAILAKVRKPHVDVWILDNMQQKKKKMFFLATSPQNQAQFCFYLIQVPVSKQKPKGYTVAKQGIRHFFNESPLSGILAKALWSKILKTRFTLPFEKLSTFTSYKLFIKPMVWDEIMPRY